MVFQKNTSFTRLTRDNRYGSKDPLGTSGASPKAPAKFQIDGERYDMTLDGKIEDAVVNNAYEKSELLTDLGQAGSLLKSPQVEGAKKLLDAGKEEVRVKFENQTWVGNKSESGTYSFNNDNVYLVKNEVRQIGEDFSLRVSTPIRGGQEGENASQKIMGHWNGNGTITCLSEELEISSLPTDSGLTNAGPDGSWNLRK